ncbi:MAG: SPOR domain-containing protein [Gammaproteobacteria bacterium]|nr:SPOR domain-containing protein [Gammaproteobacteria bacterium]
MAKRRTRRSSHSNKQKDYPGWVWMTFGLAIGLSVAFAVHVKNRKPVTSVAKVEQEAPAAKSAIDNNSGSAAGAVASSETSAGDAPKERFEFYKMLPAFEMVISNEEPGGNGDGEPKAIEEPGVYMLQAGSFSTYNDANRRIAELALQGIESRVQRARVNNRDYYRVYIGPIDDLDELNMTRSRLRAAKIDVMRIRLGD